jgi:Do/DeqQ family serine protease
MVRLSEDGELDAMLIGKDADTDLAVLQIKANTLKALNLADSDQLQIGDFVVAVGSPFGLRQTVTSGIVSALSRSGLGEGIEDFIQTDAAINPGNSGGALVNLRGELVGINSQILSRSGGNMGIGFAIPSNLVKSVMAQLIETGSVSRGRLGIMGGQELNDSLAKALKVPDNHGALVSKVVPGSPAAKAGLQAGDVIVQANGKDIKSFLQLRTMVGLMRVGQKMEMKVYRDGKPRDITVTIGKNEDEKASGKALNPKLQGATFGPSKDAKTKGAQVLNVEPRSPAAIAGLRPGDVIIAVNRQPVENVGEFEKLVAAAEGDLLLQVQRGEGFFFLVIQ